MYCEVEKEKKTSIEIMGYVCVSVCARERVSISDDGDDDDDEFELTPIDEHSPRSKFERFHLRSECQLT